MTDLIVAIGLVFVLEGSLYALFPDLMKRVCAQALHSPSDILRTAGAVSVALGVALVWFMRG